MSEAQEDHQATPRRACARRQLAPALKKMRSPPPAWDAVDEASDQSFPASESADLSARQGMTAAATRYPSPLQSLPL
jgi:hypothetical protein